MNIRVYDYCDSTSRSPKVLKSNDCTPLDEACYIVEAFIMSTLLENVEPNRGGETPQLHVYL